MEELAFIDEDKFNEPTAYIYMLIMNFISAVIMLNLFLMVLYNNMMILPQKLITLLINLKDFVKNLNQLGIKIQLNKIKVLELEKI